MSWFNSYGHDLTHLRRSKCMVSAALASWIVLVVASATGG